jgi:hypothetical protein
MTNHATAAQQRQARRLRVDHELALYRHLAERLRDIRLPAARLECERLERKLVLLRAERRALTTQ